MTTFAQFKQHLEEAFSGEPVTLNVWAYGDSWFFGIQAYDESAQVVRRVFPATVPDRAACRKLALEAFAELATAHQAAPQSGAKPLQN